MVRCAIKHLINGSDAIRLFGTLPSPEHVRALAEALSLPKPHYQIYLSYCGVTYKAFCGLLVTRDTVHEPISYFPIGEQLISHSRAWQTELLRQFVAAVRLAIGRRHRGRRPLNEIVLYDPSHSRPVPGWLYGLECVSLDTNSSGEVQFPRPFCPFLIKTLVEQQAAGIHTQIAAGRRSESSADHSLFKPREQEVLRRLCYGQSEKQIARDLKISKHTVHIYSKQIYQKLRAGSRGELLSFFIDPSRLAELAAQRVNQIARKETLAEPAPVSSADTHIAKAEEPTPIGDY